MHAAKTSEQSRGRKLKEQAEATRSSRWNPTAEQLLALEEKYSCGVRTPTTNQIQQITSELRRFGKIEGKNVFYWFQNHKARERQKRRRQMESDSFDGHLQNGHGIEIFERKESGKKERKKKNPSILEYQQALLELFPILGLKKIEMFDMYGFL